MCLVQHWAARSNHSEVAEFFISKHDDVNTKNKDDWTPLHFAAACGNLNVVELILDKRDDVDAIGALTVANTLSKENSSEIVSLLEERIRKNEGITQHLNSQEEGSSLSINAHNRLSITKEDENSLQNDEMGVTSGISKPSLWVNIFAYTTVDTVKNIFQFISSPFKSAIEMEHFLPSKAVTIQSSDINGTLLLLNMFISKITGQKYISTVDQPISPLEAQGYALNIIEKFEKVLNETAIKSGISVTNLNFDPVAVQSAIVGKIISGRFSEIAKTLYSFAKEACPEFRQTDKFLDRLRTNLKEEKETVMLQQKVEKPYKDLSQEVSRKVELSKKPDTFLNGTSVVQEISRAIN